MSKRNRPNTAAEATHRRRRHAYRSAYNTPEAKAARAAGGKPASAAKPGSPVASRTAPAKTGAKTGAATGAAPAPKSPTQG